MSKNRLKHWIDSLGIRYYYRHAIVALGFMGLGSIITLDIGLGWALAWYVSREQTQSEYEKKWDHKGWVWPFISVLVVYFIVK